MFLHFCCLNVSVSPRLYPIRRSAGTCATRLSRIPSVHTLTSLATLSSLQPVHLLTRRFTTPSGTYPENSTRPTSLAQVIRYPSFRSPSHIYPPIFGCPSRRFFFRLGPIDRVCVPLVARLSASRATVRSCTIFFVHHLPPSLGISRPTFPVGTLGLTLFDFDQMDDSFLLRWFVATHLLGLDTASHPITLHKCFPTFLPCAATFPDFLRSHHTL
jgi:hypothetical protein